jgi:hypothetical protein
LRSPWPRRRRAGRAANLRTHLRHQRGAHDPNRLLGDAHALGGLSKIPVVRHRLGHQGVEGGIVEGLEPVVRHRPCWRPGLPGWRDGGALRQGVTQDLLVSRRRGECAAGKGDARGDRDRGTRHAHQPEKG